MNFKLNTFLEILEGSWISQKTTYYLKTNRICCNQFNYIITIDKFSENTPDTRKLYKIVYGSQYKKVNDNQKQHYYLTQLNKDNLGLIEKYSKKSSNDYKYSIYQNNCLKIEYKRKNIEYTEYIHTINQKFITNISFLKKADQYVAISFSSNIKIKILGSN